MTDEHLPEPPVPADADLRHFAEMPLQVQRLRDSELATVESAEVFRVSVLSWCIAWHQVPAASLPDNDVWLSSALGFGRDPRRWKSLRAKGALRGWIRCRDGRLYHPVLVEICLTSLSKSEKNRGAAMARWRPQATENKQSAPCERKANAMPKKGREGNRREEKGESPPTPPWGDFDLPPWLPRNAWLGWCAYRAKLSKKGWTEAAAALSLRELGKLYDAGDDPQAVIEQSVASGWTGLFPLRRDRANGRGGSRDLQAKLLDRFLDEREMGEPT